jgi:hypothetical protein
MAKRILGRPFKKGQSGNPKGRPKLPPEIKILRSLDLATFLSELHDLWRAPRCELERILDNKDAEAGRGALARALFNATKGDLDALELLLNRLLGKVPDKVEMSHGDRPLEGADQDEVDRGCV